MASVATSLPNPHTRRTVRHVPIEERVAVLETHAPTVATKADVRGAENRMILWILGAALALAGFCFAILAAGESRMDKRMDALAGGMDKRMDALAGGMDKRMDALESRMDSSIAELKADNRALNARIDRIDERLDRMDAKLDARFDALMAEVRAWRRAE